MFLSLLALAACAPAETTPAWAVQHGSLLVSEDGAGLTGYQVWDFFSAGWEKNGDASSHVCARVQTLSGFLESTMPSECDDCLASYALTVEELQTDCDDPVDEAEDFGGLSRLAVGDLPSDLTDGDPYPGESLGWYASWGGESDVAPFGYLWNEALDLGERPSEDGWAPEQRYVFEAAAAWAL